METVIELREILHKHSLTLLSPQFGPLLQEICALSLDRDKGVRRDSLKLFCMLLVPASDEQLDPYSDVLISHLNCALTHIDPGIQEDALHLVTALNQNCSNILVRNSRKVLPNLLDMISKLNTEAKPGRRLTTSLNSKSTDVKQRTKVLQSVVALLFGSMVRFVKSQQAVVSDRSAKVVRVNRDAGYIGVYLNANSRNCEIDFELADNSKENVDDGTLNMEELMRYVELLMPLMFDSWIEVCPDEKSSGSCAFPISTEALDLLKAIVEIMQTIIECIDALHAECDANIRSRFKTNFENAFAKNLISRFPYSSLEATGSFVSSMRNRKRQRDFSIDESYDVCLGHNLMVCQIFVWLTSVRANDKSMSKSYKKYCTSVLTYLNEKLENWSNRNNALLPQLTKLLRTLFLKASKIWYRNRLDLSETLQLVVNACCDQSKREMQLQLFPVVSDIMLDHTLHELHGENAFKEFISTLPNLLLQPKIHESTIQIINKIVLRYRKWIEKELVANHDSIIGNAKKIEIIGSEDEKRSRLMICNLFYFLDTQIFY